MMVSDQRIVELAQEAAQRISAPVGHSVEPIKWAIRTAIRETQEACAKVCEEEICACCWDLDAQAAAEHLADTIRGS